jgi:magnesium chelatase family protein
MKFARVHTAYTFLLKPHTVHVETDITRGLHTFAIVGLPDKGIDEAKDRVSAAIKHAGFKSPKQKNEKVIISLAPAHIRKDGGGFDMAIALSYLLASEEIEFDPKTKLFIGELALDGTVRSVRGILPLIVHAKDKGFKEVFVPYHNADEASLVDGVDIYAVKSLQELVNHLSAREVMSPYERRVLQLQKRIFTNDFSDIKGQESAKRALEIAAAGGHNICMYGPPGTGKTMLARAFSAILPQLSFAHALEVTGIHSVAGILEEGLLTYPPFRAPHHTSSYVSLVGGGTNPRPGEVTLAHKGVLFLDEFPEFDKKVLECLRQPLEDRLITVARAKGTVTYPAHVMLIAAMNPCPCGYRGSQKKECRCRTHDIARYERKISGPIMDRIDMYVEVSEIDHTVLLDDTIFGETSAVIADRVEKTRKVQYKRYKKEKTNSELSAREIKTETYMTDEARSILELSAERIGLSPRAFHRVIKLARTIADLCESREITEKHILEALQYRPKNLG